MSKEIIYPIIILWPLYVGMGALASIFIEKTHKNKNEVSLIVHLAYWFLLGAALTTLIEFLLSLLKVPFRTTLLVLIFPTAYGLIYQKKFILRSLTFRSLKISNLIFWMINSVFLYLLFIRSLSRLIYAWDAIAFWLPKMFSLWMDQTVNARALLHFNHPEYPLLLPLSGANAFTIINAPNDIAVKAVIFGFSLALIFLIGDFLLKRLGFFKALFWMLLFLSSFVVRDHLAGEYVGMADILLGTYVMAGAIFLLSEQPLLAFIFWSLAPWVKSEGLVISGVSFILLFIFYKKLRISLITIGALLLSPWFLYVRALKLDTSQYFKFGEIYARPWIEYATYSVHAFREEFRNLTKWNLLFFFFLAGTLTHLKRIWQQKELFIIYGVLAAQFVMYLFIFTITPEEQASFIAAAISRITLHMAPTILIVTACLLNSKWRIADRKDK